MKAILLIYVLGLMVSCSGGNFAGNTPIRQPAIEGTGENPIPPGSDIPDQQRPDFDTRADWDTSNPDDDIEDLDDVDPFDRINDRDDNIDRNPNRDSDLDEDDDRGSIFDGLDIEDLFQGILGDLDELDEEITFGDDDTVFHIGDNAYEGSTCKVRLNTNRLEGTQFIFEFEVLEDNTTVGMDVTDICGVDLTSNYAYLEGGAGSLKTDNIRVNARRHVMSTMTLNRGLYKLRIESRESPMPTGGTDRDDFMVGRVKVKSDKPVKKGDVRAI